MSVYLSSVIHFVRNTQRRLSILVNQNLSTLTSLQLGMMTKRKKDGSEVPSLWFSNLFSGYSSQPSEPFCYLLFKSSFSVLLLSFLLIGSLAQSSASQDVHFNLYNSSANKFYFYGSNDKQAQELSDDPQPVRRNEIPYYAERIPRRYDDGRYPMTKRIDRPYWPIVTTTTTEATTTAKRIETKKLAEFNSVDYFLKKYPNCLKITSLSDDIREKANEIIGIVKEAACSYSFTDFIIYLTIVDLSKKMNRLDISDDECHLEILSDAHRKISVDMVELVKENTKTVSKRRFRRHLLWEEDDEEDNEKQRTLIEKALSNLISDMSKKKKIPLSLGTKTSFNNKKISVSWDYFTEFLMISYYGDTWSIPSSTSILSKKGKTRQQFYEFVKGVQMASQLENCSSFEVRNVSMKCVQTLIEVKIENGKLCSNMKACLSGSMDENGSCGNHYCHYKRVIQVGEFRAFSNEHHFDSIDYTNLKTVGGSLVNNCTHSFKTQGVVYAYLTKKLTVTAVPPSIIPIAGKKTDCDMSDECEHCNIKNCSGSEFFCGTDCIDRTKCHCEKDDNRHDVSIKGDLVKWMLKFWTSYEVCTTKIPKPPTYTIKCANGDLTVRADSKIKSVLATGRHFSLLQTSKANEVIMPLPVTTYEDKFELTITFNHERKMEKIKCPGLDACALLEPTKTNYFLNPSCWSTTTKITTSIILIILTVVVLSILFWIKSRSTKLTKTISIIKVKTGSTMRNLKRKIT